MSTGFSERVGCTTHGAEGLLGTSLSLLRSCWMESDKVCPEVIRLTDANATDPDLGVIDRSGSATSTVSLVATSEVVCGS